MAVPHLSVQVIPGLVPPWQVGTQSLQPSAVAGKLVSVPKHVTFLKDLEINVHIYVCLQVVYWYKSGVIPFAV